MTVIATGRLVHECAAAAEEAESEGISVEVVDPRTLQPLDEETLVASVKKTNRAVVAHEAVTRMGFGAEVAAVLQYQAFDWLDAPIERVGAKFTPLAVRAGDGEVRRPARRGRARRDQADGREGLAVATEVKLPRLGQGMESGTIVRWLKSEGEAVAKGEPLYELDTDKVTQEVEAEASGVLLKIAVAEGEVPVGQTVAFIGAEGEDVPEVATARRSRRPSAVHERRRSRAPSRSRVPRGPPVASTNGRIKASPLARRIARERGIDLAAIRGTGPDGRIVAEDVERAEAGAPTAPQVTRVTSGVRAGEVERVPLTNIRKTIARRLTEAWQIPVFQLQASADMTRANALVAKLRERDPERSRHRHRRPDEGLRAGAHAPPRGERRVHGGRDPAPSERERRHRRRRAAGARRAR